MSPALEIIVPEMKFGHDNPSSIRALKAVLSILLSIAFSYIFDVIYHLDVAGEFNLTQENVIEIHRAIVSKQEAGKVIYCLYTTLYFIANIRPYISTWSAYKHVLL